MSTQSAKIGNLHKNIMGTLSFDGKFGKMRKAEDFIVYPVSQNEHEFTTAKIQSDKRSGLIHIKSGYVTILEGRYFNGAVKYTDQLTQEELTLFRAQIAATASGKAGSNGIVFCDNSGAIDAL